MTTFPENTLRANETCVQHQTLWHEVQPRQGTHRLQSPDFFLLPHAMTGVTEFLLVEVGNKLLSLFSYRLLTLNLKLKHFSMLFALGQQGSLSQFALGEHMGLSRGAMVQNLDHLERRGLVQRQKPNESDRRPNHILLTEQGRDVLLQALDLAQRVEVEMMAPLSAEEQVQLKQLVRRLDLTTS